MNCSKCKFCQALVCYDFDLKRTYLVWQYNHEGFCCTVRATEGEVVHYKGIKATDMECEYFKERE